MAKNLYMNDGRYLSQVATQPATPASGQPVMVGDIPGVALVNEGAGGNDPTETSIDTGGVYMLLVTGAITEGAIVYFVVADGTLTATVGTNKRFGYALAAGTSVAVPVKIGY